jgi:hypothetical protein
MKQVRNRCVSWQDLPTSDGRKLIVVGHRKLPLPIFHGDVVVGRVTAVCYSVDRITCTIEQDEPMDETLFCYTADVASRYASSFADGVLTVTGDLAGLAVSPIAVWAWPDRKPGP